MGARRGGAGGARGGGGGARRARVGGGAGRAAPPRRAAVGRQRPVREAARARPWCGMSKTLRKKRHWLSKVQECVVSWGGPAGPDPELLHGGAERGEFPYLAGRLPTGAEGAPGPALLSGKAPAPGDVLLEVNGTPVSGLTHRDTLAVIRHFREPVRLKTVRPGEPAGRARPLQAPRRGLRAAGPGARPKLARAARGAGGAAVRAGEAPALGPAGGPRGRAGQCGAVRGRADGGRSVCPSRCPGGAERRPAAPAPGVRSVQCVSP